MKRRCLPVLAAVVAAASIAAPAFPAGPHAFSATYTGHGSGQVSGTTASGSATAAGHGSPIGRGTLTGSATGRFVSQTCVAFTGRAVLHGSAGTVSLAARAGHACADPSATNVTFSGSAAVTGGTSTFAGAHGTLAFSGTFSRATGAVRITFRGRISY